MSELCDDMDNNCDGTVDNDAVDAISWYSDADADGFGHGAPALACTAPAGTSAYPGDCDDADPEAGPHGVETCNGRDDDCDGAVDEAPSDGATWYQDSDHDGFGATDSVQIACDAPQDHVATDGDCDDDESQVHPWASETDCLDPRDYNCDGSVGYQDNDHDGFVACQDCNDARLEVFPGAPEYCNGLDDDCDGVLDPDSLLDAPIWYADSDGDGWGDEQIATRSCASATRFVASAGDCEDQNASIYPGALEVCEDGLDNDCDGTANDCGAWGQLSLSTGADLYLYAESAGDHAGAAVSSAGDFTGDGQPDILIGATTSSRGVTYGGAVFVTSASAGGLSSLQQAHAVITGENTWDHAGNSVAALGDTNGDGFDDALIGAYFNDAGGAGSGAAYLILGPVASGVMSLSQANAKLIGEDSAQRAGISVDGPGDVDGDGFADMLIGAQKYSPMGGRHEGAAYLVLSPVSGSLTLGDATLRMVGDAPSDYAGQSVAGVGDFTGDGLPDLGVGAPGSDGNGTDSGAVYFVCDPAQGTLSLSDATTTVYGAHAQDGAGSAVSGAGDVNGDGYDDALVGAYVESSYYLANGAAYVLLGPMQGEHTLATAHASYLGVYEYEAAGSSVDGGGDLNQDGWPDIMIGAPYGANGLPGRAYVQYGPLATGSYSLGYADAILSGEQNDDRAGVSVSMPGDLNADGVDDLLIGAWENTHTGVDGGAAYVVFGGNP